MKNILRWPMSGTGDGNIGLAMMRVAIGAFMMTHGVPKLLGGPDTWKGVGSVFTGIGVPGPAAFWGFMAAIAESVFALSLALGALTRLSAGMIAFTMAVAVFVAHRADPFARKELALLYLIVSLFFVLKGGGRYSADRALGGAG